MNPHGDTGHARSTASGQDTVPLVRDNPEESRFDIYAGKQAVGYLKYRIHDGEMSLLETAIDRRYRMDNLTPLLISHALGEARRRQLTVLPLSPAVRHFLAINPQFNSSLRR